MTRQPRTRVYVDTETTGLDPDRHELVEIAYCTDHLPVATLVVPHQLVGPDPVALKLNGYLDRELYDPARWCTEGDLLRLYRVLTGARLVGANPAFDAAFLTDLFAAQAWSPANPWHHRLLDVEGYGMAVLGLDDMPGLADLASLLVEAGYDLPSVPDHTAASDVTVTRAIFHVLQYINSRRGMPPSPAMNALRVPAGWGAR